MVQFATRVRALLICVLSLITQFAAANSDPLVGVLTAPGGAGLGAAIRVERSPYVDGRLRYDLVPLYLYEGKFVYLHAYRLGLKLKRKTGRRLDVFVSHRFEGYPNDRLPSSLAGMAGRGPGVDAGMSFQLEGAWGAAYAEFLHDVTGVSHGNEFRLGYNREWRSGRLRLRPTAAIEVRDARLNDYYYGVRDTEATLLRPAYAPGSGTNLTLGLYGAYSITERWRLLAGFSLTRWAKGVRTSPIVEDRAQHSGVLALMYDFSPKQETWPDRPPTVVKALYGKSTDCNLVSIMRLSCASTRASDQTRIAGIEVGRPFVERLNGWNLDFVGYLGLLRHDENNLQRDSWQVSAYIKGYYYGFPWSDRVRTRLGFGAGVSYAQQVPFVEVRDQGMRGRNTSKLLNYLDPSIDFSIGDLFGVHSLRTTYFGFGVSHRSGIFGTSQLLGNVNGGSNYIYSYFEWTM